MGKLQGSKRSPNEGVIPMRLKHLLFVSLVCGALTAHAAGDIVTEKVIGTEFPGTYKHPASITELPNGRK